jgi:hypothetical protein
MYQGCVNSASKSNGLKNASGKYFLQLRPYYKEVLDAFHPFIIDTSAQLKKVDSGMATLSLDLEGVQVHIS